MIGTKLYKQDLNTIEDENTSAGCEHEKTSAWSEYEKVSAWCNKNNAMIVDKGEYFEVVPCPDFTKEQIPSLDNRIAVLEDAVNTLMEGATNG